MTTLAAALLRDVPRYDASAVMWTLEDVEPKSTADGKWLCYTEVLAALTAALDPAIAERAGELLPDLQISADDGDIDCKEAADLITALLAQNAALRAERDAVVTARDTMGNLWAQEKARAEAAEAEVERLRGELQNATEAKLDAISTLDAWFDRRKLGHDAVDQAVVDAASGYLRTSRVGGMPQAESDLILGVMRDMARLGLFADLFARAAITTEADNG